MEYENMAANTAESTAPDSSAQESQAVGSAAAPSGASSAEHDVSATKAFSKRLNEMSAQRTDAAIAGLGMTNPYTGKPISTLAEMQEYRAMQQADEEGSDPESAAELSRLRSKIAEYEKKERSAALREQEAAIKADPSLSSVYDEYHDEVHELMAFSESQGNEITLEAALTAIMSDHYSDIRARDIERAKAEALASMQANAAASPGSVGGAATGDSVDWAAMSDADFERHLAIAKRGGYRKS